MAMQNVEIEADQGDQRVRQEAGLVKRSGFGSEEMARSAETAGSAAAEQARAIVEARYVMALRRPRDLLTVREKLLAECRRPGFARTAVYRKPVGRDHIEGPSVRFAESALRNMGNVATDVPTVYEDNEKRIVRVSVTDLESNVTYSYDIAVDKTVERKETRGRQVISKRTNSDGQTTYKVLATEDELMQKQGALVSKAVRNSGLRILPGDILEECIALAKKVARDDDAKDPAAAIKRMVDSFSELRVTAAQLRDFLGHDVAQATTHEMDELRGIFLAIKDQETTWHAVVEAKNAKPATGVVNGAPADLKSRVAAKAGQKNGAAKPPADEPPPGALAEDHENGGSDG
jgi:hypothetical protein